jgi:translation initiation factor IF-2
VLILHGCLQRGAHLAAGTASAKVRLMADATGAIVSSAYPGQAVMVSGWRELPRAGEVVLQGTEADVRLALRNRVRRVEEEAQLKNVERVNKQRMVEREEREREMESKDDGVRWGRMLSSHKEIDEEGPKKLRLIIKGDVSGSVEAVEGAVEGIRSKDVVAKVITSGLGDVTESDVMMAKATEGEFTRPSIKWSGNYMYSMFTAMIVAFSVKAPRAVEAIAAQNHVPIYSSPIIYQIMDEVKMRMISILPAVIEKRVTGEATVLQLFDIHLKGKKIKKVAGCRVTNGLIQRSKMARVSRDGQILHEGQYTSIIIIKLS